MNKSIIIYVTPYNLGGFTAHTDFMQLRSPRSRKSAKKALKDALAIAHTIQNMGYKNITIDYSKSGLRKKHAR